MRIVVDENIPYGREAFSTLGEVATLPGRRMTSADVRDAGMLIVRSITKVNAALLEGSSVRFVATATIGEDHVDKVYLASRGIEFASAPGCNANSVADYITGTLLELAAHHEIQLHGLRCGIVGVGNVGSRVRIRMAALGMSVVLNDPPLERATRNPIYESLDAIHDCDVVTFHVPLTKSGPDRTVHLCDEAFLRKLKPGSILINSARGPVVDNVALLRALDSGQIRACILDVWEGEPNVNAALLERCFIGTPHIAGYSFDGKVNGTRQVYEAACAFLGVAPTWDPAPNLPKPELPNLTVDGADDRQNALLDATRAVYDFRRDDAAMRGMLSMAADERAAEFDRLRKTYPRRREFFNTRVSVQPRNAELERALDGIGFSFAERASDNARK